ncbi:MAG: carboxypeptidase-like regulatory domain-containing protein, partial [Planctomycetota bacterium]
APGKETLFASLHAPFDPGLRKPLPEAAAARPVRLTLPRTGGISVAVQDANGRPVPDGCIVSIQRPHVGKDVDGLYTSVRVSRPVREGRARFLFFPLGQEFYATASPLDPSVGRATTQGAHALFDGPTASGQQVAITLQLGAPHPALRGRVLDEHGKPLAEALLISKFLRAEGLAGGPPAGFGRLMKTDAEGRFTWLSNPWIDVRTATRLEVELIHWCSTGAGGDPRGPRGAFVAAGPLPPQGLDVGVVRLGSKPLLLTGSVRDARGNPIPKARIIVDGLTPTAKGERWKQLGDFRCQDDGNFSFSGSAPERLRVRCIARGYFAAPYRECQPGDRNIEFVLKPWCVVNGRFLLDPGLPTEDLEAAVGDLWSHVDKDGSFQIIALQPGVHAVDLKMMDRVMHRVEGVSVRPEEPTKLPPIDLRGRLRVLRLQVLDKDGKPPFVIRIADASAGGELLFEESVVMKGRIAIPVPVSVQRFAVSAQECRPVLVSWRKKEQKVVLGAGLRVKIRWQAPVPKPGFETDTLQELAFHLQPVANGKTPVWAALWQPYPEIMPWGQASGEQELMLPRPGFYRVVWRATPKGCYEPIVITRTATVEVKDQVAEQLLTVSLSPEVAQAFLAKRKQK